MCKEKALCFFPNFPPHTKCARKILLSTLCKATYQIQNVMSLYHYFIQLNNHQGLYERERNNPQWYSKPICINLFLKNHVQIKSK